MSSPNPPADPDPAGPADPNPLLSLFRRCTVRVDGRDGTFRGSGFWVAPGTVVTCGHVIHGLSEVTVVWQGEPRPAIVVASYPPAASVPDPAAYPLPDLAVLTVDTGGSFAGHPCARLSRAVPVLGTDAPELFAAGHTIEHDAQQVAFTAATVRLEAVVEEGSFELYKVKDGQVPHGFSGAPVLDLDGLEVVAVLESTRDREAALGGFAVPATALGAVAPDVAARSSAWHQGDDRWARAAEQERTQKAWRAGHRGRLPLAAPKVDLCWDEYFSPAEALRPRYAVVPYVGRESLLANLESWYEGDAAGGVGVWFVTGPGGQGKTRLAVEACAHAERRGWTAGLLPATVADADLDHLAEWPGRLLVAVDYAETRPAVVGQLVARVAARGPRPAVRILLLVRRRSTFKELLAAFNEGREERLAAVLHRASLSRLDDADAEVDRLALFEEATAALARLMQVDVVSEAPPRLRADHFAQPLFVLVAASLVTRRSGVDVDALGEADLLLALLDEHESRHWQRWADRSHLDLEAEDQRSMVAVATLLGAEGEQESLGLVDLVPHLAGDPPSRKMAIARWLAALYPPPGDGTGATLRIGPLEPDRLGEALVADTLRGRPDLLANAEKVASADQLARLLTVTTRVARDDESLRQQLRTLLDQRFADLLGHALAGSPGLLAPLVGAMHTSRPLLGVRQAADRFPPNLPVWLRPLAADVTQLAADGLRDEEADSQAPLAGMLNDLGSRLSDAGRRDQALTVAQEAADLYRQLAAANPDAFLPDLAMSLNNLANCLSDAGRRDDAVQLFAEVLQQFGDQPAGRGLLLLARARWHEHEGRIIEAVADLAAAAEACDGAGLHVERAEARSALRRLRTEDAKAFDEAWATGQLPLPVWLAYPTSDDALTDMVIAWITTPDWDSSASYLDEHAGSLLTDLGEAAIEHQIDANPGNAMIARHGDLLRAARESGVAATYRDFAQERAIERTATVIRSWMDTLSWQSSQAFATENWQELGEPLTSAVLEALADAEPNDRELRIHRALLALASADSVDAAYALLRNRPERHAALQAATTDATLERALALARLDSGLEPDDPEAHFRLACLALAHGSGDEAAAAMAECAQQAAPFERHAFRRRLEARAREHPELAAAIDALTETLLPPGPPQ